MPTEARHHHYISEFYLNGFAKSAGKKHKITVLDLKRRCHFETIPRNIGSRRDFNRVEKEGMPPDFLENKLSSFEGEAAKCIKEIETHCKFEDESLKCILNFIALLVVRSPQMREHWRQFQEQIAKNMLDLALDSKERWGAIEQSMASNGYQFLSNVSYEEIKLFHESNQYKIIMQREHHIEIEFCTMINVIKWLTLRKWLLIMTDNNCGYFITSDNPVLLTWKRPQIIPSLYCQSPGFGMKDTQVYFPISKRFAMIGEFDGDDGLIEATPKLVATLNNKILHFAYEQLYAPYLSFSYMSNNQEIIYGDQLF